MKRFLLFTLLFLAGFIIRAQNGNRLEALKIAYITNKLNLSPEEAQKFWPIYNQYALELKVARMKAMNNNSSEIELDESLLNIRKKYSVQFGQVLPPAKVDTFFKSEKEFGHFVEMEMERRQLKNQKRFQNNP
jgi:flagellar biosynthesis component FlhA